MRTRKIGIIGLGYVGMPLAHLFSTRYPVIGYDLSNERVQELNLGNDHTLEISKKQLELVLKPNDSEENGLFITNVADELKSCSIYIVTVPTPVTLDHKPDLSALQMACITLSNFLKQGDIIIFESTVYPGVTEDYCVPILEKHSGLIFNKDFFVGYSPERVNPGDKKHTVDKILKVTSGSTPEAAKKIDDLYASVIAAGTYLAPSIKVAEAAKVIENSQRDINIAFINELSKIFNLMGLDTQAVLKAAATKWNFMPFTPGLVGGHCIGVDPYYLAEIAQQHHYNPEIILAGRRMNDSMGHYVAAEVIKLLTKKSLVPNACDILVLGIAFKENCPDARNSKAVDVVRQLQSYGADVTVVDPWANPDDVLMEHGIPTLKVIPVKLFDAIVLTVAHKQFITPELTSFLAEDGIIYDVKGVLPYQVDGKL
jgi:UDP-N-acetyl-D-galactosamine dehydrogenase